MRKRQTHRETERQSLRERDREMETERRRERGRERERKREMVFLITFKHRTSQQDSKMVLAYAKHTEVENDVTGEHQYGI